MFNALYFITIFIFWGLLFNTSNAAFFEAKIIDEKNQYSIFSIAIFASFFVFLMALLRNRGVVLSSIKNTMLGKLDEEKQSRLLVKAFNDMAVIVEKRDIKLSEERNKAVLANKAKSDFILNISHELRTPMHAILNFADIGKRKVSENTPEKLIMCFTRIEESGERLLCLINAILDLTSLEAGRVEFNFSKSDIEKCVEESVNELQSIAQKKNITIKVEKFTDETNLVFDYLRIIQVLVNLLSNALKFSPESSHITISISKGSVSVDKEKKLQGIFVSVSDQGEGIPPAELEIIFDKFIQSSVTKPGMGGSGIGLAICREIMAVHGGKIWAENNDKLGAKITFAIPFSIPCKLEVIK